VILFLASIPIAILLPSIFFVPILVFVYVLVGGVTVRRLRWVRKAVNVTGDVGHSLGYLFVHFLIKVSQTVGMMVGLSGWRRARALFPSKERRVSSASKFVRGCVYSILYDA
jgi:hypothetical protein